MLMKRNDVSVRAAMFHVEIAPGVHEPPLISDWRSGRVEVLPRKRFVSLTCVALAFVGLAAGPWFVSSI